MPGAGIDATKSRARGWLLDQPYLLLSLTSLFWAGNTVLGRFIVGHIPPVTFAFIRWAGAFLILLPFAALPLLRDWPTIRKHAVLMTVIALTGFSAYNTMAYYGLQYTTRDQRPVAAVDRAVVCCAVDLCAVSRTSDAAPGRRHLPSRLPVSSSSSAAAVSTS